MSKNNKHESQTAPATPAFISSLFKPTQKKQNGRKVWSIDLETVWLPFFTATNTQGVTDISRDAIGAPLRLAYNQDGSVKFSKSGRVTVRVAKEISQNVQLVRENFVAGLQNYVKTVRSENDTAFNDMVKACVKAGKPIAEADKENLDKAMKAMVDAAIAEAEAQANSQSETTNTETEANNPELVNAQ